MTEQQSSPEQMATGEGAGEYGGTYKVRGGDRARAGSARCRRSPRSAAGAEVSPVPKRCAAGWGSKRPPNAAGWRCHCWDKRVHTLFGAAGSSAPLPYGCLQEETPPRAFVASQRFRAAPRSRRWSTVTAGGASSSVLPRVFFFLVAILTPMGSRKAGLGL